MATRKVRFEFLCDKETLKFNHNIPSTLVDDAVADASQLSSQYMNTFVSTIKPLVGEHYRAAFEVSHPVCCICSSLKTQVITTPMSWLHIRSDPFINVICNAACGKAECDTKVRQNVQFLMTEMSNTDPVAAGAEPRDGVREVMPCRVCKTMQNTFKCSRCRTAFYCGKEHQKMDWPLHKAGCRAIAQAGPA